MARSNLRLEEVPSRLGGTVRRWVNRNKGVDTAEAKEKSKKTTVAALTEPVDPPASEKQISFVKSLMEQYPAYTDGLTPEDADHLTKSEASHMINQLLNCPEAPITKQNKEVFADIAFYDPEAGEMFTKPYGLKNFEAEKMLKDHKNSYPKTITGIDPDTPIAEQRFVVFDTETSALSPREGHIVQFAGVVMRGDGTIEKEFSTYVKPPDGNVGRTDIHRVRPEDVTDAPTFKEITPELEEMFDGAIMVAHNAAFDWKQIRGELVKNGDHEKYPRHPARLCTLELARELHPDIPSRTLGSLCEKYGVDLGENAHDAKYDARATGQVLTHLLRTAGVDAKTGKVKDLERLGAGGDAQWKNRLTGSQG